MDIDVGASDDAEELKVRPGLMDGSSRIGEPGLAKIWGHRTTYGRPFYYLDDFEPGDMITVTTTDGQFNYQVTAIDVVSLGSPDPAIDGSGLMLVAHHPGWTTRQEFRVLAIQQ